MIFDALATLLVGLVTGLLGVFPTFTIPSQVTGLGDAIGNALHGLQPVFPITTLGVCIGLVVVVRLFVAGFQLVVFVYRLIPLKFT